MQLEIFADTQALLEHLSESLKTYSLKGGPQHISLSGGSTPKAWFEYLASSRFAEEIVWENLHFWWGDDRMVPVDSPESNFGEAQRLLFDKIVIPEDNLHPVDGVSSISEELTRLEAKTSNLLNQTEHGKAYDWIVLGVGTDGHTASLFPDKTDYQDDRTWVPAQHPETGQNRISLSAKAIAAAPRITYLAMGESKASVVDEVLNNPASTLPAAKIKSQFGQTEWCLDDAAYGKAS